jgi:Putative auto-transporter adhesin, head GIN domain
MQHVLRQHPRLHLRRQTIVVLAACTAVLGMAVVLLGSRDSRTTRPVEGSGVAATATRAVPAFRAFELAGSNQVAIRVGPRRSVTLHGDDNLLPLVTTRVEAGTLVLGNERSFATNAPMSVDVTVPTLRALTISGLGTVVVDGVRSPRLTVVLDGSGVVRVAGRAGRLVATVRGSGQLALGQLAARDVRALLAGAGQIVVVATRSLDASLPGTGEIAYSGNPRDLTRIVTGTGSITPR